MIWATIERRWDPPEEPDPEEDEPRTQTWAEWLMAQVPEEQVRLLPQYLVAEIVRGSVPR